MKNIAYISVETSGFEISLRTISKKAGKTVYEKFYPFNFKNNEYRSSIDEISETICDRINSIKKSNKISELVFIFQDEKTVIINVYVDKGTSKSETMNLVEIEFRKLNLGSMRNYVLGYKRNFFKRSIYTSNRISVFPKVYLELSEKISSKVGIRCEKIIGDFLVLERIREKEKPYKNILYIRSKDMVFSVFTDSEKESSEPFESDESNTERKTRFQSDELKNKINARLQGHNLDTEATMILQSEDLSDEFLDYINREDTLIIENIENKLSQEIKKRVPKANILSKEIIFDTLEKEIKIHNYVYDTTYNAIYRKVVTILMAVFVIMLLIGLKYESENKSIKNSIRNEITSISKKDSVEKGKKSKGYNHIYGIGVDNIFDLIDDNIEAIQSIKADKKGFEAEFAYENKGNIDRLIKDLRYKNVDIESIRTMELTREEADRTYSIGDKYEKSNQETGKKENNKEKTKEESNKNNSKKGSKDNNKKESSKADKSCEKEKNDKREEWKENNQKKVCKTIWREKESKEKRKDKIKKSIKIFQEINAYEAEEDIGDGNIYEKNGELNSGYVENSDVSGENKRENYPLKKQEKSPEKNPKNVGIDKNKNIDENKKINNENNIENKVDINKKSEKIKIYLIKIRADFT